MKKPEQSKPSQAVAKTLRNIAELLDGLQVSAEADRIERCASDLDVLRRMWPDGPKFCGLLDREAVTVADWLAVVDAVLQFHGLRCVGRRALGPGRYSSGRVVLLSRRADNGKCCDLKKIA